MTLRSLSLAVVFSLILTAGASAQDLPSIAEKTDGMTRVDGFVPVYLDARTGTVWLEVERWNEDFLYVVSLPVGLGSNDIGLDRNQLGGERLVRFERFGPKVMLVVPNLRYRARTDNAAERKSVEEAFASGILHGFTVAAETDGRVLVDATSFVLRDAHGVTDRLQGAREGSFKLDTSRSAPYTDMIKGFPKNTEIEALLTFTSDNPGREVRSVASEPGSFTVRQRHSFVELPGAGYTPRLADPRSGYYGTTFADYSAPIGEDMRVRYISRHRLEKKDPAAERSEAVEPIVYYLDPGTPEPVRSALLDGARWWNEAFEAAGFINAFQVRVLPDSADAMDVRYNMINWVHRSTRGWSYGSSVTDPRTGEIIKGHVLLGSLRVRQDYLIAEGLLAPYADGIPDEDAMLDISLARIRQLSAHEIGHTLGIMHNYAASGNDRASVMDYPAPLATLTPDGRIDLSSAYDTGIGEWDMYAIRYGYTEFSDPSQEAAGLEAILKEMRVNGYEFITDADARPAGSAHANAHLWDNGTDIVDMLSTHMDVRKQALNSFGVASIRPGRPLATLEEALVPLYLGHRYQVEAVSKLIGGSTYTYTVKGDGQALPVPVSAAEQLRAIDALLHTVTPQALAIPKHLRQNIPPRPPGFGQTRELFDGETGLIFDPYLPGAIVSQLVFGLVLDPARTTRLTYQKDMDRGLPDLSEVLVRMTSTIWDRDVPADAYDAEMQRTVQRVWIDALLDAASRSDYPAAARSRIVFHLRELHDLIQGIMEDGDHETRGHRMDQFDTIDRWLFRPYQPTEKKPEITTPPGSPIGMASRLEWLASWEEQTLVCAFDRNW